MMKKGLILNCYHVKCSVCGEQYTECWELEPFIDTPGQPEKCYHEPEFRECCGAGVPKVAPKVPGDLSYKPNSEEVIRFESLRLIGAE